MPVALKSGVSFRDEEGGIRLELKGEGFSDRRRRRTGARLTLNETMKPSLLHSSTMALRTFGTWSISIVSEPFPDWILCCDCAREYG